VSELEQREPQQFPNVLTGEVIDRSDLQAVASYLNDLIEHRRRVLELVRFVESIIVEASEQQGTKTLHFDGKLKAEVSTGQKIGWDVEKLEELLGAGLPAERFADLLTIEQTVKVNAHVAKSIESSGNPEYARIIEEARSYMPEPKRVRISGG
jgi:hypothetical protein